MFYRYSFNLDLCDHLLIKSFTLNFLSLYFLRIRIWLTSFVWCRLNIFSKEVPWVLRMSLLIRGHLVLIIPILVILSFISWLKWQKPFTRYAFPFTITEWLVWDFISFECQVPQAFHLMVFSIYWQSFIDESEFAILLVLHAGDFFCLIALTCKRTDIRSILFSPSAFPYWHMVFDIVYIMADVYCAWSYD